MKNRLRALLFRSFDTELTSDEKKQFDEALGASETLRQEQERLVIMRRVFGKVKPSFRPFFAERVIHRLEANRGREMLIDPFFESLLAFFRPVVITVIVLIIITLSINAVRNNGNVMAGVVTQTDVSLEEAFNPVYTWLGE